MNRIVHPLIVLRKPGFEYDRELDRVIDSLELDLPSELLKIGKLPATATQIDRLKLTEDQRMALKSQRIDVSYPIILNTVDLADQNSIRGFFDFLQMTSEAGIFRINDEGDYRFLNVFIRDMSRVSVFDINDRAFYEKFEEFIRENRANNRISLSYFFNILLDKFHEHSGNKLADSGMVFSQLGEFIRLVVGSTDIKELGLNHCMLPTTAENLSSVRYNSIGMSSVGLDQEKVRRAISLKRKVNFLDEIISKGSLTEDVELDIASLSRELIESNFSRLEKDVAEDCLSLSFRNEISDKVEEYRKAQDRLNFHLQSSKVDLLTKETLVLIDNSVPEFEKNLESAQKKSILFVKHRLDIFNQTLQTYLRSLFKLSAPEDALKSGQFGLNALLEAPREFLTTEKGDKPFKTLPRLKEDLEETLEWADKVEEYKMERESIVEGLSNTDQKIRNQYVKVKDAQDQLKPIPGKKNFINLIIVLVGGILSLLLFGEALNFKPHVFLALSPFFVGVLWGGIRYLQLREKLKEEKETLDQFTLRKHEQIINYSSSYNAYYFKIQNEISSKKAIEIITGLIAEVESQCESLQAYEKTLEILRDSFEDQFQSTNFNPDIFNVSLVSQQAVEKFCENNKLRFFNETNLVYSYYTGFLDGQSFFEPLEYPHHVEKLTEGETIERNLDDSQEEYLEYLSLSEHNTQLFMAGEEEVSEIIYSDVQQGRVGDCYFMAALAGIAHKKPSTLKPVLKQSEAGYSVIFHRENGSTEAIELDDQFWFTPEGIPAYAQFGSRVEDKFETWPMYMEKAWAKLNGADYTNINGDDSLGNSRDIDYSLAITGKRAIREFVPTDAVSGQFLPAIKRHLRKKPVVVYSRSGEETSMNKEIAPGHAFTMLKVSDDEISLYDPHGKVVSFGSNELIANFEVILYFDFDLKNDSHLFGVYSNYLSISSDYDLVGSFDKEISKNLKRVFDNKNLEELLSSFEIEINQSEGLDFADSLLTYSTPYVYRTKPSGDIVSIFMLGKNPLINEYLRAKLDRAGTPEKDIQTLNEAGKKIGILKVRNDLKMENVTNSDLT
ncbi:MAG: hypothetical protein HEP71_03400 [Roseivirga sp.]|nr:hypothetical protein [Roseivirga sp.]